MRWDDFVDFYFYFYIFFLNTQIWFWSMETMWIVWCWHIILHCAVCIGNMDILVSAVGIALKLITRTWTFFFASLNRRKQDRLPMPTKVLAFSSIFILDTKLIIKKGIKEISQIRSLTSSSDHTCTIWVSTHNRTNHTFDILNVKILFSFVRV